MQDLRFSSRKRDFFISGGGGSVLTAWPSLTRQWPWALLLQALETIFAQPHHSGHTRSFPHGFHSGGRGGMCPLASGRSSSNFGSIAYFLCNLSLGCQLKKYSQPKSWVIFYSAGIFRTSSLGGSISSNPERTALRRQGEGNQVIQKFCNKGQVVWTPKDYC